VLTPRPQNLTVFGDRLFKKRGEVVNRRSYEREHEIAQSCPTLFLSKWHLTVIYINDTIEILADYHSLS